MNESTKTKDPAGASGHGSMLLGYLLLATLPIAWGLNWPAMKLGLGEVPPWTFRAGTVLGAGTSLLLIARLNGHSLRLPPRSLVPFLILALFNITIWHMATAFGIPRVEASRAAIIAFTMPVWAAMLATWLLRERITRRVLLALGCGLSGLAILMGPDILALGRAPLGAGLILVAAFSWAIGTVSIKRYALNVPSTVLTGWMLIIGGLPIIAGWIYFEGWPDFSTFSTPALAGWAYATFVAQVYCQCTWVRIVNILPATIAAIGSLAIPIVGVLSSGFLLGEPIGAREIVSLILVVGALATLRGK